MPGAIITTPISGVKSVMCQGISAASNSSACDQRQIFVPIRIRYSYRSTYGRSIFVTRPWLACSSKTVRWRGVTSRALIFGARISLLVGIVATVVSLLIGVTYGAVSGFAGGRTDEVMMRIVDILYAIPFMFFVIILLVLFGRSLILLFAAIGAVE